MERLYQRLGARGLELLAVSEDEGGGAPVAAFARELGLSFPVLLDPDRLVGGRYGVWGYPETFVIDRSGRIAERVIGPRHWDTPESVAALERLLASGDGTPEPAAAAP
jgi:peroxiredoxin